MDISRSGAGLWNPSGSRFTHEFSFRRGTNHHTSMPAIFILFLGRCVCRTITPFSPIPLLVSFAIGETLYFLKYLPPFVHLHDFCDITHAIVFRFIEWFTRFRHFERCTGLQGKKRDVPGHVNRENQVRYILSNG